jgi:hypothetical protein
MFLWGCVSNALVITMQDMNEDRQKPLIDAQLPRKNSSGQLLFEKDFEGMHPIIGAYAHAITCSWLCAAVHVDSLITFI